MKQSKLQTHFFQSFGFLSVKTIETTVITELCQSMFSDAVDMNGKL